jgi:hypothetical protein
VGEGLKSVADPLEGLQRFTSREVEQRWVANADDGPWVLASDAEAALARERENSRQSWLEAQESRDMGSEAVTHQLYRSAVEQRERASEYREALEREVEFVQRQIDLSNEGVGPVGVPTLNRMANRMREALASAPASPEGDDG